jgi:hypothetical protein
VDTEQRGRYREGRDVEGEPGGERALEQPLCAQSAQLDDDADELVEPGQSLLTSTLEDAALV